jgi:hypothetical protein
MEGNCGEAHRRDKSGEVIQVVDGELAPVTDVGDEVADEVQQTTEISNL